MMTEQHTIEQLQAMSDSELAELAARLRGWTLGGLLGKEEIDVWCTGEKPPFDNYELQIRVSDWNPAADIGQAYGLLVWAKQQGRAFRIILSDEDAILYRRGKYQWDVVSVLGNDARAMVYAFVLAMEAING